MVRATSAGVSSTFSTGSVETQRYLSQAGSVRRYALGHGPHEPFSRRRQFLRRSRYREEIGARLDVDSVQVPENGG